MPLMHALKRELGELRKYLNRQLWYKPSSHRHIIDAFHRFYYESGAWDRVTYFGVRTQKYPGDMWVYQELLHEVRPQVVVECGTAFGGSALYLAHLMDHIGVGRVISIDINHKNERPQHPRITYLTGSSTDPAIITQVKTMIGQDAPTLVILDSDHSRDHVLKEMELYAPLVDKGSYMIVEDSNVNGHPADPSYGPGPMEAIQAYLRTHKDFAIDHEREKFLVTYNPNGYLRKIA